MSQVVARSNTSYFPIDDFANSQLGYQLTMDLPIPEDVDLDWTKVCDGILQGTERAIIIKQMKKINVPIRIKGKLNLFSAQDKQWRTVKISHLTVRPSQGGTLLNFTAQAIFVRENGITVFLLFLLLVFLRSAKLVIKSTGSIRRNHGCPDWPLRRAMLSESRTISRLLQTEHDFFADAHCRFMHRFRLGVKRCPCVESVEFFSELESAVGYRAKAPPLKVHQAESIVYK